MKRITDKTKKLFLKPFLACRAGKSAWAVPTISNCVRLFGASSVWLK